MKLNRSGLKVRMAVGRLFGCSFAIASATVTPSVGELVSNCKYQLRRINLCALIMNRTI
jgi:hypothetical protein